MKRLGSMEWLTLVVRVVIKGAGVVSVFCLCGVLLFMITDPLMRYLLGRPFFWSNEVTTYLMLMMFFTNLGYSLVKGMHIRVTVIFNILPRKVRNAFWIMISFVGLVYSVFLTYSLVRLSFSSFVHRVRSDTSGIFIFPWQMIGAMGLIIFLMAVVIFAIRRVAIAFGIREETEEEKAKEIVDLGF